MLYYNENSRQWQTYYSPDFKKLYQEIFNWCWTTFGHPGTDPETGINSGWDYQEGWIFVYDEKHYVMFTLRWP